MKKFWKAAGMAAAWLAAFMGAQLWISLIAAFLLLGNLLGKPELLLDTDLLMEQYMGEVLKNTAPIILISNLVFFLMVWAFFAYGRKPISREICLKKTKPINLLLAILFGFGVCYAVSLLTSVLPIPESMMDQFEEDHSMLFGGNLLINFLATALAAPVSEEICFRGLCYTRLKTGMRPLIAGLISAVLFGIAHGNPVWFLVAFLAGAAMAWIFEITGSLWCSILVHVTNNTIAFITTYVPIPDGVNIALTVLGLIALVTAIGLLWRINLRKKPVEV